jgi:ribosomal protein S18 acetylase RimI-like enzyme
MSIEVRELDPGNAPTDALAALLVEVTANGSSVGFMYPLAPARAAEWWRVALADAARGGRIVFGAFADGALAGTVTLAIATPENQPHRAEIMKLQVGLAHRRAGVGEQLMAAAEARAAELGRTLLVLDTASDDARRLYERRGWTRVGDIPDYALWPNGEPCATTIYWKRLELTAARSA